MKCKINSCYKEIMYVQRQICQMHYFRHMRNGTYDKIATREYRYSNPKGYILIYEPEHELSQAGGYVYEHRFVLFNKYGYLLTECDICGSDWNWNKIYYSHVDHIDGVISNNEEYNLRPLCNSCNVKSENRHYL